MKTEDRRLTGIIIGVFALLSIPFIAMQFDNGVNWDWRDFIIAGVLLLGTGLTCEWVLRRNKSAKSRFIYCAIALFVLFLIWAELAVGVFGSPFAGS